MSTTNEPQPTALSTVANHPPPANRSASLAPPTLRPAHSPPPYLTNTLHILYTNTLTSHTSISSSPSACKTDPIYLLDTRVTTAPHVTLFRPSSSEAADATNSLSNNDSKPAQPQQQQNGPAQGKAEVTGEEIATATFPAHGSGFSATVRGQHGISVKSKSAISSSLIFSTSVSGAERSFAWKGDRHGLTCTDTSSGMEVAKLSVKYPKDELAVGKLEFWLGKTVAGEEEAGDRLREVLVVTALAVQELKGRKGQGLWGNMGKGMMLSTGV